MLFQEQLEIKGASGKVYMFDVFSKGDQLPDRSGVYIITYSHPRGHLAGFQVNILSVGMTTQLGSAIAPLIDDDNLSNGCWNYTCVLWLDDNGKMSELFDDIKNIDTYYV